jgi:hypothetical protein
MEEKYCTACKRKHPITDFHKTSRKFQTGAGLEKTYVYYHAKCKLARNRERMLRHYYKKILEG